MQNSSPHVNTQCLASTKPKVFQGVFQWHARHSKMFKDVIFKDSWCDTMQHDAIWWNRWGTQMTQNISGASQSLTSGWNLDMWNGLPLEAETTPCRCDTATFAVKWNWRCYSKVPTGSVTSESAYRNSYNFTSSLKFHLLGSVFFSSKKQQRPCRVRLHCAHSPLSWRIMDCQFLSPASRYRKESNTSCFFWIHFWFKGLKSKQSKPGIFILCTSTQHESVSHFFSGLLFCLSDRHLSTSALDFRCEALLVLFVALKPPWQSAMTQTSDTRLIERLKTSRVLSNCDRFKYIETSW